jgi:hypothetical protein
MRFSWWFYFTKFSLLALIVLLAAKAFGGNSLIAVYVALCAFVIIVIASDSGALLGAAMILQ